MRSAITSPERYLLVRPLGGLNDVLCQVEFARRKAEQSKRLLVVQSETGSPGLKHRFGEPFSNVFTFVNRRFMGDIETLRGFIDTDLLFWPREFEVLPTWIDKSLEEFTRGKIVQCRLESLPPRSAQVAVHEGYGGGFDSFSILEHLELTPKVVETAKRVAKSFPSGSTVFHFRNSDYKSNFEDLLEAVLRRDDNSMILIASDDPTVVLRLQNALPHRKIFSITSVIRENFAEAPIERAILEMLVMTRCSEMILIPVQVEGSQSTTYSGFGRLAEHLWVVRQMQHGRFCIFLRHILELGLQSPRRRRNPIRFLGFISIRAAQLMIHAYKPKGVYKQLKTTT